MPRAVARAAGGAGDCRVRPPARVAAVPHRPLAVLLLLAAAVPAAGGEPEFGGEPRPLFDGESFAGWFFAPHADPRAVAAMAPADRAAFLAEHAEEGRKHWTVADDEGGPELVCDGDGPFLWTDRNFADFELSLEWNIAAGADSGVYVRGCPQVQIWDPDADFPQKNHLGSGGLWNNPAAGPNARGKDPAVRADAPVGQWNAMTVRVVGRSVTVTLNGQRVVTEATLENFWDRSLPLPPVGPIILQTHGGRTRWRNLVVTEIPRAMPESGFLSAAGEPLGDGWEPAGGATATADADAHLSFGPLATGDVAEITIGTRVGTPGPTVRVRFAGPGSDEPVTVENPLGGVAALGGAGDESGADLPVPGVRLDAAVLRRFDPAAENRVYVDARGGAVTAYLNGTPFLTAFNAPGAAGRPVPVAAGGAASLDFVRAGAADAAAPADEAGFTPVPLDPGLPGWSGDVAGYEAAGGVLTCRGGGNVYLPGPGDLGIGDGSPDDWRNFAVRFEFKLPPGGNNGVGLRCERGKDAAYFGRESQLLDNTAPQYANLKPYQYHGSVYGVAAATRGALNPVGHWNTEEIVCDGDRVRVTVNGVVVVDADVRKASAGGTTDGNPHPGLLNAAGAVGFLGHGAPVAWRNLRIKTLPAGDPAGGTDGAAGPSAGSIGDGDRPDPAD